VLQLVVCKCVNLLDSLCDACERSRGLIVGVLLACFEALRIDLQILVGCLTWPLYCWLESAMIANSLARFSIH
jgi:hypothetical protein